MLAPAILSRTSALPRRIARVRHRGGSPFAPWGRPFIHPLIRREESRTMTHWKANCAAFSLAVYTALASQGCTNEARGEDSAGRDRSQRPAGFAAPGTPTTAARKPASETTKRANADQLRSAPFSDTKDFESARRGLIAPLPNDGVIKDKKGKVVWN